MWSQRFKPSKNIIKKHIKINRVKDTNQADTVFLSDYKIGNAGQRNLFSTTNHLNKFGYAILIQTKTGIEVLALIKEFLKTIWKSHIFQTDYREEFNSNKMNTFFKKLIYKGSS